MDFISQENQKLILDEDAFADFIKTISKTTEIFLRDEIVGLHITLSSPTADLALTIKTAKDLFLWTKNQRASNQNKKMIGVQ